MAAADVPIHEAAEIFPLDEETIGDLAKDIRVNGLLVPIERLDGKVIDGRRRLRACQVAGVQPQFRDVKVSDPVAYVLSLNLHRRHLTPGQRSMVGARARKWYDDEAKKRQKVRKGSQPGASPANLPELEKGDARDQVGKVVGVSGKSIDHATKVLNRAIPEVVQAVDEGRMSVSTAAILASESEEEQRAEAAHPKRRRDYRSVSNPVATGRHEEDQEAGKSRGVGVIRANEAINSLIRIPKNDPLRKRGFQIVTDWIRANK
jgi:hypothetical protein